MSCKIYNAGLFNINQNFKEYNTYLAYSDNYKLVKSNIHYKMLQANCSKQSLKRLEAAFKSYFELQTKLQSKLPNGQHNSKLIHRITQNRNNCINDYIKKTAKTKNFFCLQNQIGNVILGCKVKSTLGKVNNQNFQTLPICKLRDQIVFNCKKYEINCIIQEESYTSKASFLDNDNISVYYSTCHKRYNFSGKRICRGVYSSANTIIINADINGAANILRKCMQNGQLNKINLTILKDGRVFLR